MKFFGSDPERYIVVRQFGEALVYFWGRRVRELFPEKNIVVELGDSIMGERGTTITMYEDTNKEEAGN